MAQIISFPSVEDHGWRDTVATCSEVLRTAGMPDDECQKTCEGLVADIRAFDRELLSRMRGGFALVVPAGDERLSRDIQQIIDDIKKATLEVYVSHQLIAELNRRGYAA
jgi:hypothetical protein